MSRLKVGPVGRAVQAGVQHAVRMMRAATAGLPRMAAKSYFNSDADRPAGIPTLMRNVGAEHRRCATRRSVERSRSMVEQKSAESDAIVLRHLRELVAALDQRVPHIERAGEAQIARDAAELRERALQRIAELERNR